MKKGIFKILLGFSIVFSANSFAWVIGSNQKVSEVIQWHGNEDVYFKLSNGTICYMPENEDKFYSLLLSLWASQKRADFHCYEDTKTTQGVVGHRVHRIIAKTL